MGHLFYEYAATETNMLWEVEFTDQSLQTVHTELVFAPCFNECREEAELIQKRIKKDVELAFHISEVVLDETD